jgi:hypothetical protein
LGVADHPPLKSPKAIAKISPSFSTRPKPVVVSCGEGLVERAVNDQDRRARLCRLTSAGAALLAQIETSARSAHRATLEGLSEREQAVFIDMMQRIVTGKANRDSAAALFD